MNRTLPVQRGVTFGFYAPNGYLGSAAAREELDRLADLGVDWVCLVPTVFQETYHSTVQFRDFAGTPDDHELRECIDYAHRRGLKVLLRPMLETLEGDGRLSIWFPPDRERIPGRSTDYWARWFRSLRERSVHYARLAAERGCEQYGLDSELDRTVGQNGHWKEVLAAVREVYPGPVTSCHTRTIDFLAELRREDHWFHDLDSLSCSFYVKAADAPGAGVEQMVAALQPQLEYYREVARLYGKPFYFGECGCTSSTGAAISPSGWSGPGGYAPEEQANYLEATLRVFWPEPWWTGLYWWKWDEHLDRPQYRTDLTGDKGFTIAGKPAAGVMRRWFTREDRR